MEQLRTGQKSSFARGAILFPAFVALLLLVSCKSEDPNPELIDPIYNDLNAELKSATAALAENKKSLEDNQTKMALTKYPDLNYISLQKDRAGYLRVQAKLEQQAKYLEIRVEQRKEFARADYRRAFRADKPWPNPEEFEEYKARKRLRSAPRSWDKRVPKLTRYNKPAPEAKKAEKNSEGGEKAPPPPVEH